MNQIEHWHIIEKANNRKGAITSAVVHGLLLLLLLVLIVPTPKEDDTIEGVLIDFGHSKTGFGQDAKPIAQNEITPVETETAAAEPASTPETSPAIADEAITQDVVEAPSITPEKTPAEIAAEKAAKEKAAKEKAEAEAREKAAAEKAALEKAAQEHKDKLDQVWANSGDGSEGESTSGGDQGVQDGVDNGPHNDGNSSTGLGDSGVGHDLSGRKMVKKPTIKDSSQKTGKVAVKVRVDRTGKVISAKYTTQGSNTTDAYLIRLAEQAAREAKFNSDPNAASEQIGKITFTFRVQ